MKTFGLRGPRAALSLALLWSASMTLAASVDAIAPTLASAAANAVVPNASITGFSPTTFSGNDDGTYPCGGTGGGSPTCVLPQTGPAAVPFGFKINFDGAGYNSGFINNNGNVTLDAPQPSFTPANLNTIGSVILAPFFADVDTTSGNTVNFGTGTIDGHNSFVVNWPGVNCLADVPNGVVDNFQLIIIDRPDLGSSATGDNFQLEYNYNTVQWDVGQADGGNANCTGSPNAALVGWSDGTTATGHSYQLKGSLTQGGLLDSNLATGLINNDLNSSVLGRYIWTFTGGTSVVSPKSTTISTQLTDGTHTGTSITTLPSTAVTDQATLSGSNTATAAGAVTYTVYSNASCTTVAADGGTVSVSGGTVPLSNPVSLGSTGTYYWQASYSGDAQNDASVSGCDEIETVALPVPAPTLTAIAPTSGAGGGGSHVTLTGTNLSGASAVSFGANAASFTVVSGTSITATAPASTTGAGPVTVTVTTPGGTTSSTPSVANTFTYLAPTVTRVYPASGPAGGGSKVTISGTWFQGATTVTFGTVEATSFTISTTGTTITAIAPASISGAGPVAVVVTTPAGATSPTTSAANTFTYLPPVISAISPNAGPVIGGNTITIKGTGLTGPTQVKFGSIAATTFSSNPAGTAITVVVPAAIPLKTGAVAVTVSTPGGTTSSALTTIDSYSYRPPKVTGIAPASGSVSTPTTITITGSYLQGTTKVSFGTTDVTSGIVVAPSGSSLTVPSPLHSVGAVVVTVTTAPGFVSSSVKVLANTFTFTA